VARRRPTGRGLQPRGSPITSFLVLPGGGGGDSKGGGKCGGARGKGGGEGGRGADLNA